MTEARNQGTAGKRPRRPRRHGQPSNRAHLDVNVPDGFLAVGRVISAHGTRGEVAIEPYTDFPEERFAAGQSILLGDEMEPVEIESMRPHKNRMLLRFDHVVNRDDAEAMRGTWLFIPEDAAVELEEDTYFVHQILGLTVQTEEQQILGTVTDVLFTGANEVYVIKPAESVNKGRDILIPATTEVIKNVDLAAGLLTVALLPGIVDAEE